MAGSTVLLFSSVAMAQTFGFEPDKAEDPGPEMKIEDFLAETTKKSEPLEEKLEDLSEKIEGKPLSETIAEFQEGIKGTKLEEKFKKLEENLLDGPMGEQLAAWGEKMEEKMEEGQMD